MLIEVLLDNLSFGGEDAFTLTGSVWTICHLSDCVCLLRDVSGYITLTGVDSNLD